MSVYVVAFALLLGVVVIDVVAMRRLAPQRVAPAVREGWAEYRRIAGADPSRLNPTQQRLVKLGRLRSEATDVGTARRIEDAMDRLVSDHRRHLS